MKSSKRSPPGRAKRFRALLGTRAGHVLSRTTLAALIFLFAGMVMRQARAYTYRLDGFRVHADAVSFTGLPPWADDHVRRALEPRYFPALSVSIYDPDAEAIVRAHVEAHPLVQSVEEVRILFPRRAEVDVVLRAPVARVVAWVRGPQGHQVSSERLLSNDGCLLPSRPYRTYLERLPYALPLVAGIRERPPRAPGEIWEDRTGRVEEAVEAAKLAARLYRDFRGRVTLTRVDVSRFPATGGRRVDGEVRLVVSCPPRHRGGPRVERTLEWGRTERTCAQVSSEDTYDRKVERLRRALTSAHPPTHVEVRWDTAGPAPASP